MTPKNAPDEEMSLADHHNASANDEHLLDDAALALVIAEKIHAAREQLAAEGMVVTGAQITITIVL